MRAKLTALILVLSCPFVGTAGADQPQATSPASGGVPVFPKAHGSQIQRVGGGVVLTTYPGTKLERQPPIQVNLGSPTPTPTRTYVYRLVEGRVDVAFAQKEQRSSVAVLIVTATGKSAIAHGGDGTVVSSPEVLTFTAHDKPLLVGKGSHWRPLAPERTLAIDRKRGTLHETGVPAPPRVSLKQPLTLNGPDGFSAIAEAQPTQDAKQYQFALFKRDKSGWVPVTSAETQGTAASVRGTTPGEYAVLGRALNRFGIAGGPSVPAPLRVVGVELPPGASHTKSGISLSPDQRIRLMHAEGLKMTYGADNQPGNYFVSAPDTLSLLRGMPTSVHLMDPDTSHRLKLNLVPQLVDTTIELGPATARWPRDTVQIEVKLRGTGNRELNTEGYKVQVSVNLDPVKVAWKRSRDTIQGSLSSPSGAGPWVIRVTVINPRGTVVARNFLEVAKG